MKCMYIKCGWRRARQETSHLYNYPVPQSVLFSLDSTAKGCAEHSLYIYALRFILKNKANNSQFTPYKVNFTVLNCTANNRSTKYI